jgi:hypothetical protein
MLFKLGSEDLAVADAPYFRLRIPDSTNGSRLRLERSLVPTSYPVAHANQILAIDGQQFLGSLLPRL